VPSPQPGADRVSGCERGDGRAGVQPRLLVLTNGGAEAIALVAADVGVGSVVEPEFSLYRRHLLRVDEAAPRWRSNPSNPLGRLAAADERAAVWDEAFYPLATGRWTRADGGWRLCSLTKLWSCPGLRLGAAIAPDAAAADRLRAAQPQWSVNGLALALLPALLATTDLPSWAAQIAELRTRFAAALRALSFDVRDTEANWVLLDRPGLRADLAPHGVIVRDCASFGLPGIHRVALPPPDAFDRVVAAFATIARR
jgi:histidinol-phosphate/aromatic aminotransferase/cobyric acid decarboxylase-like protein